MSKHGVVYKIIQPNKKRPLFYGAMECAPDADVGELLDDIMKELNGNYQVEVIEHIQYDKKRELEHKKMEYESPMSEYDCPEGENIHPLMFFKYNEDVEKCIVYCGDCPSKSGKSKRMYLKNVKGHIESQKHIKQHNEYNEGLVDIFGKAWCKD